MPTLDSRSRELLCKVVFAGPVAAGVGTTFHELWSLLPAAAADALVPGPDDPPIYRLRYRPKPAIRMRGVSLCFELWGYEARPVGREFARTLEGADGVILVLDSHPAALDRNEGAIDDVRATLEELGTSFEDVSMLLQYNKRDHPDALPLPQLEERFNPHTWPFVATSSSRSQGLQELLDRLSTEMVENFQFPATPTRAPTDSMTSAFQRAERKLFGTEAVPKKDDERTVLGAEGASPFAADPPPAPATPRERADLGPVVAPREEAGELPLPKTIVNLAIPQLAGYRFVQVGTPELSGAQRLIVPFVAETRADDASSVAPPMTDVVLHLELVGDAPARAPVPSVGKPAGQALPTPPMGSNTPPRESPEMASPSRTGTVTPRRGPGPKGTVSTARTSGSPWPISWYLFGAALVVVVVIAYLLGAAGQ